MNRVRLLLAVVLVALMFGGCRGAARTAVPTTMAEGQPLQAVAVEVFSTTGAKVGEVEAPPQSYGVKVADVIASALRKAGVQAAVATDATPTPGAIVIEGKVVVVDGGSRAARYLSGMSLTHDRNRRAG
jgi:hypothetical protein